MEIRDENMHLGKFEDRGQAIGKLVDEKELAYGQSVKKTSQLIKIFLQDYRQEDGTYILSEPLLEQLLLQVRIIDKQNRIFNNPSADRMNESPYSDIAGYGLLGETLLKRT